MLDPVPDVEFAPILEDGFGEWTPTAPLLQGPLRLCALARGSFRALCGTAPGHRSAADLAQRFAPWRLGARFLPALLTGPRGGMGPVPELAQRRKGPCLHRQLSGALPRCCLFFYGLRDIAALDGVIPGGAHSRGATSPSGKRLGQLAGCGGSAGAEMCGRREDVGDLAQRRKGAKGFGGKMRCGGVNGTRNGSPKAVA